MVLTLFKVDWSPPVRSVYMTIEALQIPDVEIVDVNLFELSHLKEEYLKLNPQHTVPMLKDDDFVVWDSHAIAAYLVTKYGADDSLYPVDPQKRALVDQRLHFDSGILFSVMRATITEPFFVAGEKELRPESLEKIKEAYKFTDDFLAGSDWLAGDSITLADICAAATISTTNTIVEIGCDKYPNLAAWIDRISQQDFYKKGNEPGLKNFIAIVESVLQKKLPLTTDSLLLPHNN